MLVGDATSSLVSLPLYRSGKLLAIACVGAVLCVSHLGQSDVFM